MQHSSPFPFLLRCAQGRLQRGHLCRQAGMCCTCALCLLLGCRQGLLQLCHSPCSLALCCGQGNMERCRLCCLSGARLFCALRLLPVLAGLLLGSGQVGLQLQHRSICICLAALQKDTLGGRLLQSCCRCAALLQQRLQQHSLLLQRLCLGRALLLLLLAALHALLAELHLLRHEARSLLAGVAEELLAGTQLLLMAGQLGLQNCCLLLLSRQLGLQGSNLVLQLLQTLAMLGAQGLNLGLQLLLLTGKLLRCCLGSLGLCLGGIQGSS
mmetsp:Transcript_8148/g.20116  ORF Transcript_8148/g.20116 Transcript_8148/m.20116 type:complete len:269 (-) Transcript_8148:475-1281(-)